MRIAKSIQNAGDRKETAPGEKPRRSQMGMGTLEVVIIIAALLTLALFFSNEIKTYAGTLSAKVFDSSAVSEIEAGVPGAVIISPIMRSLP